MPTDSAARVAPRLIFGLGNPGLEYRETRHNLGFRVVDELARRWSVSFANGECRSQIAKASEAELVKPQTFMNRSGYAVRCLVERRESSLDRLMVIFDDVNLPLGTLRMRAGGSPGGHRGLESVVENLRSDRVPRLRLGIASERSAELDLADFVLQPFTEEERPLVDDETRRAADACECWLAEGIDTAMTRFNGAAREYAD